MKNFKKLLASLVTLAMIVAPSMALASDESSPDQGANTSIGSDRGRILGNSAPPAENNNGGASNASGTNVGNAGYVGIQPTNGNNGAIFEVGAPAYEGGDLIWGDEPTIRICNDGCNVVGSCCDLIDWCQTQCPHCREGHPGRSQNVYLRGTATGPVTWEIVCPGGIHRDEFTISHNPVDDKLVIAVRDGYTICRGRRIELAVTRNGITATVFIELIACCFECGPFCLGCDECFHCTVDPCPCESGLCENCCECPIPTISKKVFPLEVLPEGTVNYTITINTDGMSRAEFFNRIRVLDELHEYLTLDVNSINVDGVRPRGEVGVDPYCLLGFSCSSTGSLLRIVEMYLEYCLEYEYYREIVITFSAIVSPTATPGTIPNVVALYKAFDNNKESRRTANAEFEIIQQQIPTPTTSVRVNKLWVGDEDNLDQRPASITVHLRRPNQSEPVRTATLSAPNWSHTWTGLPRHGDYYVVEIVPAGYHPIVVMSGDLINGFVATITNTFICDNGNGNGNGNGCDCYDICICDNGCDCEICDCEPCDCEICDCEPCDCEPCDCEICDCDRDCDCTKPPTRRPGAPTTGDMVGVRSLVMTVLAMVSVSTIIHFLVPKNRRKKF